MGLISEIDDALSCMTWGDALKIGCISAAVVGGINLATTVADNVLANTSFEYNIDENGDLEVSGQIKSGILGKCYLVERINMKGN